MCIRPASHAQRREERITRIALHNQTIQQGICHANSTVQKQKRRCAGESSYAFGHRRKRKGYGRHPRAYVWKPCGIRCRKAYRNCLRRLPPCPVACIGVSDRRHGGGSGAEAHHPENHGQPAVRRYGNREGERGYLSRGSRLCSVLHPAKGP